MTLAVETCKHFWPIATPRKGQDGWAPAVCKLCGDKRSFATSDDNHVYAMVDCKRCRKMKYRTTSDFVALGPIVRNRRRLDTICRVCRTKEEVS